MTTSEVMSELEKNVTVAENNLREAQSKTVDDSQIKSAETRKTMLKLIMNKFMLQYLIPLIHPKLHCLMVLLLQ